MWPDYRSIESNLPQVPRLLRVNDVSSEDHKASRTAHSVGDPHGLFQPTVLVQKVMFSQPRVEKGYHLRERGTLVDRLL